MDRPSCRLVAALGLVTLWIAVRPPAALAQCTYNPLTNDSPATGGGATTLYSANGASGWWGAVGTRSASGSNHDLALFTATAASPTCVANAVGASATASGVDFVIGDFRPGRNSPGTFYPKVTRTAGAGSALTEWDAGGDEIIVDDLPITRNTDQVLDVYQVFLEGGVSYVVDFRPSPGVDAKVLIFRNPTAVAYWADRSMRLLESSGPASFPAPASDEYAVVVVNDDGGLATYSLAIEQCQPPNDLTSGVPVSTSAPLRYVQAQVDPYWSAVGVRGAGTDDWNITAYRTGHGALEPVCFQDTVVSSSRVGAGVDFVVGDFNANPAKPYYTRVNQVSGSQVGIVEWDTGQDLLTIGAAPTQRSTGPGDVLESWDVELVQGQPYTIYFEPSGAADTRFFVFEDPTQTQTSPPPYWGSRAGAVLTGTGHTGYTPATSGYHGIVVVNDNGGVGTYKVGVYAATVGVGSAAPLPARATLDGLAPNPAFGRTTIAFSLPRAGRVGFDVLDVTGRLVARIPARDAAAGPGRQVWDARAGETRVRPGVYFVRMDYGGAPAGLSKLVLLP